MRAIFAAIVLVIAGAGAASAVPAGSERPEVDLAALEAARTELLASLGFEPGDPAGFPEMNVDRAIAVAAHLGLPAEVLADPAKLLEVELDPRAVEAVLSEAGAATGIEVPEVSGAIAGCYVVPTWPTCLAAILACNVLFLVWYILYLDYVDGYLVPYIACVGLI